MKLQCQVEVINRQHNLFCNSSSGKYLKSILALGKEPKLEAIYFILHFSTVNKSGTKYHVKCIKQVFTRFINEGKSTIRFEDPPHDLCIKSETVQLKCFMKLLKNCITGDTKNVQIAPLSSLSVVPKDIAPTKLVIRHRGEFPCTGLPRTLETLHMNGLKLYNFRPDILLLKRLVVLDLGNNELEKLPPEFGTMPSLCELYLANNNFGISKEVDWQWLIGPQIIKALKLLDISGNKLELLPKSIWKLQKLVTLKLDHNMLNGLPSTIGRMGALRYLTAADNNLRSLPCSLMQCRLNHLDLSHNKFNISAIKPKRVKLSPWQFYIGNLKDLVSKVVLKHKLHYAPNIIPRTLVDYLDDANMCLCGVPVVNNSFYLEIDFELKDYFPTVILDSQRHNSVTFQCYFCSDKCFKCQVIHKFVKYDQSY